ncbi:Uncharacterised protein [Klebsiella pneumoniae subsp. ozaenae]|uniref:Uncharacterized protein n=1 Tax=Klebsiella pneumoniae subsp. ozaenae TaxID=574 RepID=A0A377YZP1_KLEPO|nr:Uncharacterised protein [Klebsiella pneumoniae subsp. ozaenae]
MSNRLNTEILINLTGNLTAKARPVWCQHVRVRAA